MSTNQPEAQRWQARKAPFTSEHDECVRFVACDYSSAVKIAKANWPNATVIVWNDEADEEQVIAMPEGGRVG